jgi:hypothetical protein
MCFGTGPAAAGQAHTESIKVRVQPHLISLHALSTFHSPSRYCCWHHLQWRIAESYGTARLGGCAPPTAAADDDTDTWLMNERLTVLLAAKGSKSSAGVLERPQGQPALTGTFLRTFAASPLHVWAWL